MITDQDVLDFFVTPHQVAIRKIYDESLEEMNNGGLNISIGRLYSRVQSAYLNNVILEKAKPYFRGVKGITLDERYNSLVFTCDCGIIGKFKKAPKNKYPPNPHLTGRDKAIANGSYQPSLFPVEIPVSVSLEINHTTNAELTEFYNISVIKKIGPVRYKLYDIPAVVPEQPETMKSKESDFENDTQITIKRTVNDNES
jgi:hypothetical protein